MAFAMRINFTDVVVDDSLKSIYLHNKKVGYQFDVRLSYYRGHFLSVIDQLGVAVDGEEVPTQDIAFCLNGKEFGVAQLHDLTAEWWDIRTPATIKVNKAGGLEPGEHDVDFTMFFHSPYMPLGDPYTAEDFMPIDGCGQKTLTLAN